MRQPLPPLSLKPVPYRTGQAFSFLAQMGLPCTGGVLWTLTVRAEGRRRPAGPVSIITLIEPPMDT